MLARGIAGGSGKHNQILVAEMFTSKGLFSTTPCPYREKCPVPRCIFSHTTIQSATVSSVESTVDLLDFIDQSGKRKRRRLNEENEGSPRKNSRKGSEATLAQVPTKPGQHQIKISTLTREISPPPLRRAAQSKLLPPARKLEDCNGSASSTSLSASPTLVVPARIPAKVVVRTEFLNPRSLKGPPPASHDLRLRLLRALHEQLSRLNSDLEKDAGSAEEGLVLDEQSLITKALNMEEEAAGTPSIYANMVKNKIMTYKKMNLKQWVEERTKEVNKSCATKAVAVLDSTKTPATAQPKQIETGFSADEEISLLYRLFTPITGLTKHGYVNSVPSDYDIEIAKEGVEAAQGWEQCDRCKSRFQVFPGRRVEDGALTSGGNCTYHYGKPYWQERSAMDPRAKRVKRWRCCNEETSESAGCTKSENHVFKISEVKRMASVLNFEKTPEDQGKLATGPVCIDAEMGYTVYGLELIRLTATSWPSGSDIFDVLVRPLGEILDLNSRFSGVWPKDMADALPWSPGAEKADSRKKLSIVQSPQKARELLFSHLTPQTPLIGHGLENDLNACRIIHPTVIDTVLLYPHRAGLPYRHGLKALMQTHLHRDIQSVIDGKMTGHDSKEDANAAGDLVRYALKPEWEKMTKEGWTLSGGIFEPPAYTVKPGLDGIVNSRPMKRSRDEIEDGKVEDNES